MKRTKHHQEIKRAAYNAPCEFMHTLSTDEISCLGMILF